MKNVKKKQLSCKNIKISSKPRKCDSFLIRVAKSNAYLAIKLGLSGQEFATVVNSITYQGKDIKKLKSIAAKTFN